MTAAELFELRRMARIGTLLSDSTACAVLEEACLLRERLDAIEAELQALRAPRAAEEVLGVVPAVEAAP